MKRTRIWCKMTASLLVLIMSAGLVGGAVLAADDTAAVENEPVTEIENPENAGSVSNDEGLAEESNADDNSAVVKEETADDDKTAENEDDINSIDTIGADRALNYYEGYTSWHIYWDGPVAKWDPCSGANQYSLEVQKEYYGYVGTYEAGSNCYCDLTEMFLNNGPGKYIFSVTAYNNGSWISASNLSDQYKFTYPEDIIPAAPVNLKWTKNRTLNGDWDDADYARSYSAYLYKDGKLVKSDIPTNGSTTELAVLMEDFGSGSYTFRVRTHGYVNDSELSEESPVYNYTEIPAPAEVTLHNGVASWTAVDDAWEYCYNLYKDGTKVASGWPGDHTLVNLSETIRTHGEGTYQIEVYTIKYYYVQSKVAAKSDNVLVHLISYDMNGHGRSIPRQVVDDRSQVQKVEDPFDDSERYIFRGWYNDPDCTEAFDYNAAITRDRTLYAKWEERVQPDENGKWVKNSKGWWFENPDGSYPESGVYTINGKKYAFNDKGYMVTGWYMYGGSWYYFSTSGAMCYGWVKANNKWYYMDPGTGKMKTGFIREGKTYYLSGSGAMVTGWNMIDDYWYFFDKTGAMVEAAWEGNYYLDCEGIMVTYAFIKNGSKFYWVNKDGKYTRTYSEKDTEGYMVFDQATGSPLHWVW